MACSVYCSQALAFGWWRLTPDLPEGLPEGERAAFAVGALLIVGCYFAGVGYSYRLVFAVLLPWLPASGAPEQLILLLHGRAGSAASAAARSRTRTEKVTPG